MFRRLFGSSFGQGRVDHIETIYQKLDKYGDIYRIVGLNLDYRKIAPPDLVEGLFELSEDEDTTVQMVRVLHQRQVVEGMLTLVDVEEARLEVGEDAAREDARQHYESAKGFCDEIMGMAENGTLSSDPRVGVFLKENLSAILLAAGKYSSRF